MNIYPGLTHNIIHILRYEELLAEINTNLDKIDESIEKAMQNLAKRGGAKQSNSK